MTPMAVEIAAGVPCDYLDERDGRFQRDHGDYSPLGIKRRPLWGLTLEISTLKREADRSTQGGLYRTRPVPLVPVQPGNVWPHAMCSARARAEFVRFWPLYFGP